MHETRGYILGDGCHYNFSLNVKIAKKYNIVLFQINKFRGGWYYYIDKNIKHL